MWPSYTPTYMNKIDQILNNNPDRNSESVLNELLINQEDLISEFKRSNPKLLDYFRDNQKLVLKLVEYISEEASDLGNVDRGFKYPLVSSEVFDCVPPCIMTQFFIESKDGACQQQRTKKIANCESIKPNSGDQDDDCCDGDTSNNDISAADATDTVKENDQKPASATHIPSGEQDEKEESAKKSGNKQKIFSWPVMNKLFQFLEPLTSINEVLAGYWSKVVLSLVQMKPQEMIDYILTSKGVLDGLFRHINNQSIASVVSTLLILESNKFSSQTQEFLKDFTDIKVKAIGQFIDKFGEYSAEEISNLANIFSEIISKYYLIQDGKEMLEYLCSEESVEKIFKYMVSGSDGAKNGASLIIQSLAQYYAFNANSFISGYPEGSEYYLIMLQQYENMAFLQTLISNFDAFAEILSIKENAAGGNQRETLGVHRLRIIEVMNQVIRIQFPSVQEGLVNSKILQHMLDLFFKFEWHNILHQIVLNIMLFIIQNSDKSKIRAYLKHLLCDQKLTEQMISQVGDTFFYFNKDKYPDRNTTKGNLGYIIKIADAIEKFYDSSIKNRTNADMLDWHNKAWEDFMENTLDIHKQKGCKDLGNFNKYINGQTTPETAGGEDDMAIYREYERQQAADRMNQRSSYLEQVELLKHYESKKTKGDQGNQETPKKEDQQTPTGDSALPNSGYGVSSVRSQESLSASKQNVMFVQMDSKQLDDDIQMEDDEEESIKKQNPNVLASDENTTLQQNNEVNQGGYLNSQYISDNPLIREIMQKYSPTKGLIITSDGGIVSPSQPEENKSLINVKIVVEEQEQEIIIEKKMVIDPLVEEKTEQHDEATIVQSHQEGQVNNPNEDQQETQDLNDQKTISNVADNGEEEDAIRKQEFEGQQEYVPPQINSDNNLDRLSNLNTNEADEVKSSTELGSEVNNKQLAEFQDSLKKQVQPDEEKVATEEEEQEKGIVENDPIQTSPEKPEEIIEQAQQTEEKVELIIEQQQEEEEVPATSERVNYFMSTTSTVTSGDRNKSTESIPNRLLQKKPSSSHSPQSHNKESQSSPKKNNNNNPFVIPPSQPKEVEVIEEKTEDVEKVVEEVVEQFIEAVEQNEEKVVEAEVVEIIPAVVAEKEQQLEEKVEEKQEVVETQQENITVEKTITHEEEDDITKETSTFLKESGVQEYQYVLLNKPELRSSPLVEQFEHNVSQKKTSLFTSQEITNKESELNETKNKTPENKDENASNFGENIIKVEKSEFKTFVFQEEESNYEPINIELDRVYDKEESEQKLKTSANPSPINQTSNMDSLNSLNNFKYEMKYVPSTQENVHNLPQLNETKAGETTVKTTITTKTTQGGVTTTQTTTTTENVKVEEIKNEEVQKLSKIEKTTPTTSPSSALDKLEVTDEGKIPDLTYDDSDPTIKQIKKKFGQDQADIQSRSLPSNTLRSLDDMSSSANQGTAEPQRQFGSSPMKFKQQFQENMRASYDQSSFQRISPQPTSNYQNSSSVEVTPTTQSLGELKLGQTMSSESNTSPATQKAKYLQQSQQERMQIQNILLQKYGGKGGSKNNSPQNNNTPELKPADPYSAIAPAHQQYNFKLQSPYEHPPAPATQSVQQTQTQVPSSQQTLTIGGNHYTVIGKSVPTHNITPQPIQQQQPNPLQDQQQILQQQQLLLQQQQQQQIQGISQAEKMSYVEQETVLLSQKLISSKDYQLILVQIRDMQNVYDIISDDNAQLIEQRIITSANIRQTFFDVAERSRLQLDNTIDGLEQDKQRQEKELKLQYQTEFEMIERQMKQEQDEQKARKKTQDFLQKLLVDRVNKLYEIHLKYSLQQKISLEKAILEAKNLNEKLHSMHLLVAPVKQISPEKGQQILNTNNMNIVQQQNTPLPNPQNPLYMQQQQQQTVVPKTQDDNDLNQYLVNPLPRQYHSVPSSQPVTNTTSATTDYQSQKPQSGLTVSTSATKSQDTREEGGSNSPCFGNKDLPKIPIHKQSEDSNTSDSDQQKSMYTSQGESTSPCFGNRRSPSRKSSFSQRYGGRKLSGNQQTEGDIVQEDPYDYKASSSARDKSPMPSQAAMYMSSSNSSNQGSSSSIPSASNDYLRRLTQPTTLTTAPSIQQQPPYRLSNPSLNPSYQTGQTAMPQQQQHHQRIFDNYMPPQNTYQSAEQQMNPQDLPNPSNRFAQNAYYESSNSGVNSPRRAMVEQQQPPYAITQTRSPHQQQQQQQPLPNPSLQQQQQQQMSQQQALQQQQQQQQQPHYRKIFGQTPVQAFTKQPPQTASSHATINLQNPSQQQLPQQQLPPQPKPQQPQQIQQQQQSQQQQQFLNYNYSQPQLTTKSNSNPDDQYKKISDNLKLSGYYGQQGGSVKTIQIDLSGNNDDRKMSDYVSSSSKPQEQQPPQRANQSAIYVNQKPAQHQQRGSYGQISVPTNTDQNEIENQMQFRTYLSTPQHPKSSHNTPGNGSTPVGSSSNLQYTTQQPQQLTQQQLQQQQNHKLLSQTTYVEQNTRHRPLSHSEIMYKTPQNQPGESQFQKQYGSPHTSSPQPGTSYSNTQYAASSFQQASQQQQPQYSLPNPSNPLLNNEIQSIITKYTAGKDPSATYISQQQYPQQSQYQYQSQPQMTTSEKNIQYADEFGSGYEKMKNSSTNYSSYSGNGSFYNQQQSGEILSQSDTNEEASMNSSTSTSQFLENIAGGRKIKVVMKKHAPSNKPQQTNDQHEYLRQQQLMQAKQQQYNQQQQQQQQLMHSQSSNAIKQSRQMEEKDKSFLQMLKK